MKVTRDTIEFSLDEWEEFSGMKMCKNCSTVLPLWEWAKRSPGHGCSVCKALPSQEDIDGIRREWTPADWRPK